MTGYEMEIEALKERILKLLERGEHTRKEICVALTYRAMHVGMALTQLHDEGKIAADARVEDDTARCVYFLTGSSVCANRTS